MKNLARLLVLLILCFNFFPPHHAHAAQSNPVLPTASPYPGLTMLGNINTAFQTFLTNSAGASSPTYAVNGSLWVDTSNSLLKYYDGTNFLPMGSYAGSQWSPISNGVPAICPTSTGSGNAYVVTLSPAITAYVTGQYYCFKSNFGNTSTATVNYNSKGAKAITKQGTVSLGNGDIPSGAVVWMVYDGTEMQMLSQTGNAASGSVTSITCGTGLAGGTITSSGTCSLATQATGTLLANISGSTNTASPSTLTAILDNIIGSTRGSMIVRGASAWGALTGTTTGSVATYNGTDIVMASPTGNVNVQNFTSNGTWTKPAGVTKVYVECWGGGGGGGVNACGGGGGGYFGGMVPASTFGSTVSVTIGAGGAGGTGVESGHPPGGTGGNTSFGSFATAYGGACGGGGGQFAQGVQNGQGGASDGGNCNGGNAVMGGGGGGSAGNCSGFGTTNPAGGSSVYGGAGGGGYSGNAQTGGASIFGGAAGSAPACCNAGNAGAVPGGGGGSSTNGGGGSLAGGAGGGGKCVITSW